jgi:hypothetical protein
MKGAFRKAGQYGMIICRLDNAHLMGTAWNTENIKVLLGIHSFFKWIPCEIVYSLYFYFVQKRVVPA